MSAIIFTRYQLRPGADRAEMGNALNDLSRFFRSREGCLSSRYFWAGWNHAAMLSEYDSMARAYSYPPEAVGAKLTIHLADLADIQSQDQFVSAREGTDAYDRARS